MINSQIFDLKPEITIKTNKCNNLILNLNKIGIISKKLKSMEKGTCKLKLLYLNTPTLKSNLEKDFKKTM